MIYLIDDLECGGTVTDVVDYMKEDDNESSCALELKEFTNTLLKAEYKRVMKKVLWANDDCRRYLLQKAANKEKVKDLDEFFDSVYLCVAMDDKTFYTPKVESYVSGKYGKYVIDTAREVRRMLFNEDSGS